MASMKAIVVPTVGADWELRDVARPTVGDREVLVRILASGVCTNDVASTTGKLPFPSCDPAVPGHEVVGEVVEVGPGASRWNLGDRVGVTWVRSGCGDCEYCKASPEATGGTALFCENPTTTGFSHQGGHAEFIAIDEDEAVRIPEGLSPPEAAAVMCAGYTAWSALTVGEVAPGETVAVQGLGAVGHMAVLYAAARGLDVVVLSASPEKRPEARRLGAREMYTDVADLKADGGADVILATGPDYRTARSAAMALREGGRLVLSGIDDGQEFSLPPLGEMPFFALRQQIRGASHDGRDLLEEALRVAARAGAAPMVETFSLADHRRARASTETGSVRFRAVLTPHDPRWTNS